MCRLLSCVLVMFAVLPVAVTAATPDADAAAGTLHRLRLAERQPPCSEPAGLPIVPNDPAAIHTPGGKRCYGTRPAMLELRMPEDRYVWLDRQAPNPAAWIDLGGVIVDPRRLEPWPLGLMLTRDETGLLLEARYGDTATLTPLPRQGWQEIRAPDGQQFWVQLAERR